MNFIQEKNRHSPSEHRHGSYCPFKKFCVFLNGEAPETVLAERDYLSGRVDELEFAMDFSNRQVKKLLERIKELESDKNQLESDLLQALRAPFTKYEKKDSSTAKKRGAPIGHPGWFRGKPENIDRYIDVYLDKCPDCNSENISPCNHTTEHTQEDVEDGRITVSCFIHCFYWCRNCKKVVHGWGDNEIPNAFIGPEARAKASFLRHEIKVSYDDTQRVLQHFCNLTVVSGSIVGFDNKFFQKGEPLYEALKATLPETPYIHVDETGWKRDWLWIFTNPDIAFFHIDEHRSSTVVRDHLGDFYKGILITDFYSAYRNLVPAFGKQKCCTHLLRDIKKLLDDGLPSHPDAEAFLIAVKQLVKDAIYFHAQHLKLSTEEWRSGKKEILKRFRELYRHEPLSHHETDNIRKRLITHKKELFVFLKYPAIPPTNNPAELAIRNSVLFRKITFGNRTAQGKKNVSLITTVIRTAKLRSLDPVNVLRQIMSSGVTSALLEQFGISSAIPQAP
ncbi:MAG: IS66 family transposase [Alphaproteobacteria bacterium]|nr:IS66 family transposase [Alphaproteobacteria bacterium]